jgi:hypothetical protein
MKIEYNYKNSDFLKATDKNIVKMQAYFLAMVNDEHRNILHLACHRGNLELVEFISNKAGPGYLNILNFIVNV